MKRSIRSALKEGAEILGGHQKTEAKLDARILLEYVLSYSRVEFLMHQDEELSDSLYQIYLEKIHQRTLGEPVQYIMGIQEFMGLKFKVNPSTLIPRRETEELVELGLSLIKEKENPFVIDIGTGSGCIPISLAVFSDRIHCVGVDISGDALEIAKENSKRHNVEEKVSWLCGDLFEGLDDAYFERADLIISNPPYIPTEDVKSLMIEVREFEPILALDGGQDGLDFYRKICVHANKFLRKDGFLAFEIGFDQREAVTELLEMNGYKGIVCKKDLSGFYRMIYGKKS